MICAGCVIAWFVFTPSAGGPAVAKQIQIEERACHMPAIRGAYPSGGEWTAGTFQIRCSPRRE
jgi:hypothetical protein